VLSLLGCHSCGLRGKARRRFADTGLPWDRRWRGRHGVHGLQSLGFYVVITWLPQVFQDSGASAAAAGWLLFLFQAVAVLTSLAVPAVLRWARDQRRWRR